MLLFKSLKSKREALMFVTTVLTGSFGLYSTDKKGYIALFLAIKFKWMSMIEELINRDPNQLKFRSLHSKSHCTVTAVSIAVKYEYYSILEYLVEKGADLDAGFPCPLFLAYNKLSKKYFKLLVKSGANVNVIDLHFDGSTLLHHIVQEQLVSHSYLNLILKYGADLTLRDRNGQTALHWIISKKHFKILQTILQNVDAEHLYLLKNLPYDTRHGQNSPLPSAIAEFIWNETSKNIFTFTCCFGSLKCLKMLIPFLHDEKYRMCDSPSTPKCLLHAVLSNRKSKSPEKLMQLMECLLENGVDVNSCAIDIINLNDDKVNEALKDQTQDMRLYFEEKDFSILDYAITKEEHHHLLPLLVKHGAHLNPLSTNIVSPLAMAVLLGHSEICHLLLVNGANPNYLTWDNSSAKKYPIVMMVACMSTDDECLLELLKVGGDLKLLRKSFWNDLKEHHWMRYKKLQLLKPFFGGHALSAYYDMIRSHRIVTSRHD